MPTVYPRNAYSRLRMVDSLEKMGIATGFSGEIDSVLDKIYRYKFKLLLTSCVVVMKPAELS